MTLKQHNKGKSRTPVFERVLAVHVGLVPVLWWTLSTVLWLWLIIVVAVVVVNILNFGRTWLSSQLK